MSILIFLAVLSVLIIAHEFGHFIVAKRSGVKIEQFSIGFGPQLLKIKGKETDFFIRAFLLGGYVKPAGEIRAESTGKDDELYSKPAGIRMRIAFAGPLFNYILAFVVFWGVAIAARSLPLESAVISKVLDGYPAKVAGLKSGDRVLKVDDKSVLTWVEMANLIYVAKDEVNLEVKRGTEVFSLVVPIKKVEGADGKKTVSVIGISSSRYGFFETFYRAGESLVNLTILTVRGIFQIISGALPAREAVAGPIGIYFVTSKTAQAGIIPLLTLVAILSGTLAIINLFPLPVLDGGHIFICFIEKIRRRHISERVEDWLVRFGLVVLGLLAVFLIYNDIMRFGPQIWGKKNNNQTIEISQ